MSTINWEDDLPQVAPESIQERLARLVHELAERQEALTELEDEADMQKQRISEIKTVLLPGVMDELGVSEIKLEDKTKIKVESKVNASIKKENELKVFDWLVNNGYGGLIKSSVTAEFGREEIEQAQEIVAALREDGVEATLKQGVHSATLKSFVKEQLEAGNPVSEDISVFEYKEAKITLPKSKK